MAERTEYEIHEEIVARIEATGRSEQTKRAVFMDDTKDGIPAGEYRRDAGGYWRRVGDPPYDEFLARA